MNYSRLISIAVLICACNAFSQSVKRGRNEGTSNIPASNTVGNGNILTSLSSGARYSSDGLQVNPSFGGAIGMAEVIQLSGNASFTNFKKLGSSDIHVQITSPGNDRLRFFGVAVTADLFLSTEANTISNTAAEEKPEFNSYIFPSLTIDLDWLALNKTLPLKTYMYFSLADDPDQLYLYDQLSIKAAFEWKMYENSFFIDAGAGLYKEKRHGQYAGDEQYRQRIAWLEPGGRYRLANWISLVGSFRFLVFQDIKTIRGQENPLAPNIIKLTVGLEAPLIFKETNTEAIRTLVFMEQNKEKKKSEIVRTMETGKTSNLDFALERMEFNREFSDTSNSESLKRREDIEKKMENIERMFEELQ